MTKEQIEELREKAKQADAVSRNWRADHDDTYVSAQKVPAEHDWYWVTGDMSMLENGYDYPSKDDELRGPKPVVQATCRYIAAFNPDTCLKLTALALEALSLREKNARLDTTLRRLLDTGTMVDLRRRLARALWELRYESRWQDEWAKRGTRSIHYCDAIDAEQKELKARRAASKKRKEQPR